MATDFGATLGPMNRQQQDDVTCDTVSISIAD